MKFPKKLKVCSRVYSVKFQNKHKKHFLGQARHTPRKIIIYRYSDNEKIDPDLFKEIFLHEIIHCVNAVFGIPNEVLKNNGLLK